VEQQSFCEGRVTLWCGDVRDVLRQLPENHFDCVVTSPPYFGLRDYGTEGQLGLEPSLGEHIETMVSVFAAVHRVLKPSGSLWLNYGDCYATTPNGRTAAATKAAGNDDRTFRDKPFSTIGPINGARAGRSNNRGNTGSDFERRNFANGFLKPKDLLMVPNRVAIALHEWGWWVRSEIVWGKTNPMPDSSGRWRPGTAHEKIWLLTKTGNSFYDAEAVRMNVAGSQEGRVRNDVIGGTSWRERGQHSRGGEYRTEKQRGHSRRHAGFNDHWDQMTKAEQTVNGRLLRNYEPAPLAVWSMPTDPFPEAHFATFPAELAERCIKAGCPQGGTVLDPFGGAGTTAMVALALGRLPTLIDLNPDYCTLARARIEAACMGRDEGKHHMVRSLGKTASPGPLFDVEAT
jgi:DNA modification methylase